MILCHEKGLAGLPKHRGLVPAQLRGEEVQVLDVLGETGELAREGLQEMPGGELKIVLPSRATTYLEIKFPQLFDVNVVPVSDEELRPSLDEEQGAARAPAQGELTQQVHLKVKCTIKNMLLEAILIAN